MLGVELWELEHLQWPAVSPSLVEVEVVVLETRWKPLEYAVVEDDPEK